MDTGKPSQTAAATATQRGLHRLEDAAPWILDDPLALALVGPAWQAIHQRISRSPDQQVIRRARAFVVCRARYAEDRVDTGRFSQYVVLGAGLDSFAYRRPDLLRAGLRLFEVDHPASQTWKRQRAEQLALPTTENHIFVPVDFEHDDVASRLATAGFEASQCTIFSWLGVSMYLNVPAVEMTLRFVSGCAPGSEIAWTYWPSGEEVDADSLRWRDAISERQAADGEPILWTPKADEVEELCMRCGLEVVDHPDAVTLSSRYTNERIDHLAPSSAERIITARVPID